MQNYIFIQLAAQIFSLGISIYSLKKQSVNFSGFISMVLISTLFIWAHPEGVKYLTILFSMYASSSLLSKYKSTLKQQITEKVIAKHGPRDYIQAICNLGPATLCFLLYIITNNTAFIFALIGSVATSNADSWASEIGVLSKKPPIMITNLKPCRPGISGGISLTGTISGFLGAFFIGLISYFLVTNNVSNVIFSTILGTLGMLIDSFLGATIQYIAFDSQGLETENIKLDIGKSRGLKLINNDVINLISSSLMAILSFILYFIINHQIHLL